MSRGDKLRERYLERKIKINWGRMWKTSNGQYTAAFYNAEDLESISHNIEAPTSWSICETIYAQNEIQANKKAHYALSKGAESLKFIIPNQELSIQVENHE